MKRATRRPESQQPVDAELQSLVSAAVERFQPGLVNFFMRRCAGNEAVATELTQETCTELWRAVRAGKYDPDRAAISTFFYAIANHRWLQHRRNVARRSEYAQEPDRSTPDAAPSPEDWLNVRELLDHFRACVRGDDRIHALSEREQQVVQLFASGETERAIAKTLKFAPSTVHAVKKNAFKKLQNCLHEKGYSQLEIERTLAQCE